MRQICMSGSMSGVWKRSHGRTSEAPPDERGGNRYVRPKATAPHLDSTMKSRSRCEGGTAKKGRSRPFKPCSAEATAIQFLLMACPEKKAHAIAIKIATKV